MWAAIGAIIQILFFILKNNFEKDKEKREEQRKLYEESKKAIASGDVSALNSLITKLRQ